MTTYYVPGVEEPDLKKVIRSLQNIGGAAAAATDNVATNTTAIAAINASRASSSTFGLAEVDNVTITAAAGVLSTVNPLPGPVSNSLGADVATNVSANYFTGPSVAQGTTGTWFASGFVTVLDTGAAATFYAKLWDGTTVIASAAIATGAANFAGMIFLSGYLAAPAGNIRISVREPFLTAGKIIFNATGNSKDSTLTAYRIA